MSSPYIDRVGIELEGGWNALPPTRIIADLSIDGRTLANDGLLRNYHVGEVVSEPLQPEAVPEWIKANWPEAINNTCGFHIHVSFQRKAFYSELMNKRFSRVVRESQRALAKEKKLKKSHYIWERLNGRNPFAVFDQVEPSQQVAITEKRIGMAARYAAFNYCFSMHGTLEYRVLPMFKEGPDLAIEFMEDYFSCINSELSRKSSSRLYLSTSLAEKCGAILERRP